MKHLYLIIRFLLFSKATEIPNVTKIFVCSGTGTGERMVW